MAREYAQIKLAIWADDDWRDLSPLARYLYFTLLTSPSLTHAGVADWRPTRIAAMNGMDREDVEDAGSELVEALYLVIDEDTEEALIRSFVRNDGLMKQPKMATAMSTAHAAIASPVLRGVVVHELQRLREDYPELHGWGSDKAVALLDLRSINPSTYPLGKGSGKGSGKGKRTPSIKGSGKGSPTPAPTPAPSNQHLAPSHRASSEQGEGPSAGADGVTDEFDTWWEHYPRKVGKGQARAAYKRATKKATHDELIDAIKAQAPQLMAEGEKFCPHASTWLNGERWADEVDAPEGQAEQPREPGSVWRQAGFDVHGVR